MRKRIAATIVAASALSGGVIGLTLFGPSTVGAKSGSTSTTVQPATPQAAAGTADAKGDHRGRGFGGRGFGRRGFGRPGFGGRHGLLDGKTAVAKAIGISETDLAKELRSGKTIAQVAKAHGVTTQKVIDALVNDAKAKLAAAVKAGKLTQTQANRIQTGLTEHITNLVNGTFPKPPFGDHPGPGMGRPGFGGRHGLLDGKTAVAKAIGISETDLAKELRSRKTIAQVAKAHGVTTQKVIDALVNDAKAKIAAAVKAGKLTQTQADRLQSGLTKGITNLVNGTFPKPPFGDHRGPGFGPLHD